MFYNIGARIHQMQQDSAQDEKKQKTAASSHTERTQHRKHHNRTVNNKHYLDIYIDLMVPNLYPTFLFVENIKWLFD